MKHIDAIKADPRLRIRTMADDGGAGLCGGDEIEDGWAWMPMPEPYKEDA